MIKPKRLCTFYMKEFNILIFLLTYSFIFFEHTILPNALYGCEILALENTNIIERLQTEFLMYITNSRTSTMLHAELGCNAVDIRIKSSIISFWLNIVNDKQTKI